MLLNPYIYRMAQEIASLNALATLLDTPSDWESRYNEVVQDRMILNQMACFRDLPDGTSESDIHAGFLGIVNAIATRLPVRIRSRRETRIVVGGLLVKHEFDLRSNTDPHFENEHGRDLLASEVKTKESFIEGLNWYEHCWGVQVLSALYAFNCPTFLLSQSDWKVFVEKPDRRGILTFPFAQNPKDTLQGNATDRGQGG
jgi:hypothetical protein